MSTPSEKVTPMMAQYMEIKAMNAGSLLFYRMGDFYELFFSDAEIASRALSITLTKRGKHLGQDIPMCGVPVERAEEYLHRLIHLGHRVAVCDQIEDPAEAKKRGAKSVVKRGVVRLVTPGTLTEERLLNPAKPNFLVAVTQHEALCGYAMVDISTGQFLLTQGPIAQLSAELARIDPAEVVALDALANEPLMREAMEALCLSMTPMTQAASPEAHIRRLCEWYGVATLDGIGSFATVELSAAALVLEYIDRTQLGTKPPLSLPVRRDRSQCLEMDAATRANLELTRTLSGEEAGSLLHTIDETVTSPGARLLAEHLANPLTDLSVIEARLEAVHFFVNDPGQRLTTRDHLRQMPDITRALSRLAMGRAGPRDLLSIRQGLNAARGLRADLQATGQDLPALLQECMAALIIPDLELESMLAQMLADQLPNARKEGGFVREGFEAELDEARQWRDAARDVVAALQARYCEETKLRLRIKHNNFLGYFIEVPATLGEQLLKGDFTTTFIHRQTMADAMRFSTQELSEAEGKMSSAAERALALEQEIFDVAVMRVLEQTEALKALSNALAVCDVAAGLAECAVRRQWSRPELSDTLIFKIEQGRHPVVEAARKKKGESFVANSCDLTSPVPTCGQIALMTGPNMAGKSTYLRQNALIIILAQMGAYVPAAYAQIGIVDRLFSRVGAADDLARGHSTFMVEMVETAAILNQATARSLVILDEIGRGTATYDGLAIAWATLEHLHEQIRARTLFATHFHELTALTRSLARLSNLTMKVTEWRGDVVFLHEVIAGAADRSYGIQVAKLAGLPAPVISRAKTLLQELEAGRTPTKGGELIDLPLFATPAPVIKEEAAKPYQALRESLDEINLDELTPRAALEALYKLKELSLNEG